MRQKVLERMRALVGYRLAEAVRALDLEMFRFRDGNDDPATDYDLHVQCPWRIRSEAKLIVGSEDRFCIEVFSDSETDPDPPTHCETAMLQFLENPPASLLVERISADHFAGLQIILSGGFVVEVFPVASRTDEDYEHWRLLIPDGSHFVVSNLGATDD